MRLACFVRAAFLPAAERERLRLAAKLDSGDGYRYTANCSNVVHGDTCSVAVSALRESRLGGRHPIRVCSGREEPADPTTGWGGSGGDRCRVFRVGVREREPECYAGAGVRVKWVPDRLAARPDVSTELRHQTGRASRCREPRLRPPHGKRQSFRETWG